MAVDEQAAISVLRAAGLTSVGVLGRGVEGVVLDLGDGTAAKVWSSRSRTDLDLLRTFYEGIEAGRPAGSSVMLPLIVDVLEVDGHLVSIERRLAGEPGWQADGSSPDLSIADIDVMTEALAALAAIPARASLLALPMLPGEPAFGPGGPFETQLAELVARRVTRFESALAGAHPRVADTAASTIAALGLLEPAPPTLVHGDLIAANVLRTGGRATAVLDFGFLSTAGDPAFDAAIAASVYDMWGPRARDVERTLDDTWCAAFGHARDRLLVYRAAYALVTACCFGEEASDGHFGWCIAMLDRPDVQDAIRG
ncbi:phosphotransferase [Nocardioides sp. GY 10127]|uniref:phosphotransferase n=1 Tax=Nocardioides sp. GY 10127 TaxID=2569762 RepID=UPI0010A8D48C|nr:phosphotransferase [Nocardioides sp. GY 10127]TIC80069.1 aminoglycoside phosphotransferase family protein [Nocardioides sp. GY 10127]